MSKKATLFSTAPVLAHSFSTPLTNILLNTEIAVKNLSTEAKKLSDIYLQRVLINTHYLRSLLHLTDSPLPIAFAPKNALQELLMLNGDTKLKEHVVSRILAPDHFELTGNKLSFQEMVVCLLNNAYESYPSKKRHKPIFLTFGLQEKNCTLSVVDGGRGMTWFKQILCTTQLYTTKENHSGLGLYFVKKTIEQEFGGRLILQSRLGRGTVVTLQFPSQA
jgi:signal transduction histidine kinase